MHKAQKFPLGVHTSSLPCINLHTDSQMKEKSDVLHEERLLRRVGKAARAERLSLCRAICRTQKRRRG